MKDKQQEQPDPVVLIHNRTGTYGIEVNGKLVEGGFFSFQKAVEAATQWRLNYASWQHAQTQKGDKQ